MLMKIFHIFFGILSIVLLATAPFVANIPEPIGVSPTLHEHCSIALFIAAIFAILIFLLTKYLKDDKA